MAASPARFEQRREQLIARLEAITREDRRLVALWLQGSLADGTADALSDVDAYLAVDDAAFDEVYAERNTLVGRLGAVLMDAETNIPGAHAIHCLLDGPVKLDLFFERASRAPDTARIAVRMLVDKVGIGPSLKTGAAPSREAAARRLDAMYRGTLQGAAWPVRLLLRGQWSTFAMCELEVINDNLASFMAARVDPGLLFKNRFTFTRLLPPEERAVLDTLTADLLAALAARDLSAVRAVHLRIDEAIVREGRAAYAALGLPYPGTEAGDAGILAFHAHEWPDALPV
jgi:predicted nucleotidyltransferase